MKTIEVERATWGATGYSLVTVKVNSIMQRSKLVKLELPVGSYTEKNAPVALLDALKTLGQ